MGWAGTAGSRQACGGAMGEKEGPSSLWAKGEAEAET